MKHTDRTVKQAVVDEMWEDVAATMSAGAFHTVWAHIGRVVHDNGGSMISDIRLNLITGMGSEK